MSIIKINITEVASELAHRDVIKLFNFEANKIFVIISDEETAYTEEAQDEFNQLYDEYYNLLWELKEEYL